MRFDKPDEKTTNRNNSVEKRPKNTDVMQRANAYLNFIALSSTIKYSAL
jgi:hypothetical protein